MHSSAPAELPDLLRFMDGRAVQTPADWPARRAELLKIVLQLEYGPLPPVPTQVHTEELHAHVMRSLDGAVHTQVRLSAQGAPPFVLDLLVPPGVGPFPVILTGDACWRHVGEELTATILQRGNVLAQFNRCEVAPDHARIGSGGLAKWAWAFHRCADFLQTQPFVQPQQIAVVGHSRGGKAALLAGATDERIALTVANASGCGGAGSFRLQGPASEKIADITRKFAYWFAPGFKDLAGQELTLPFDQHAMKALIAPRALLTTEALDDLWSNPSGSWQTYRAAKEVFRFLGAEDRIAIAFRPGGHAHNPADWSALLDFVDAQFRGAPLSPRFAANPFPSLAPGHFWAAPIR